MSWCATCSNFKLFDHHVCPPAYECEEADYGGVTIYAHSPAEAAEKYAEMRDCEGDYSVVSGHVMSVKVTAPGGKVEHFEVHGESVPQYTAYAKDQTHD